jgi:hypothetical protein
MRDVEDYDDTALRHVEFDGKWTVKTYETSHTDRYGKSGIQVKIWEGERLVYDTGAGAKGLVYVAPGDCIDSDRSIYSAVALICHECGEATPSPTWDYDGLWEANSIAECDAEEAENHESGQCGEHCNLCADEPDEITLDTENESD